MTLFYLENLSLLLWRGKVTLQRLVSVLHGLQLYNNYFLTNYEKKFDVNQPIFDKILKFSRNEDARTYSCVRTYVRVLRLTFHTEMCRN